MGRLDAQPVKEDWLLEAGEGIDTILDHCEELDLPPQLVKLLLSLDEAITAACDPAMQEVT